MLAVSFPMNPQDLEKRRAIMYRVTPARRITTMRAASQFIDCVGFCWLFAPAQTAYELPSLFEAVKGRRGAQINDWDADADMIWAWKSDLPAARRAYYGKALAGKSAFVSLALLPSLLAALGVENFDELYAQGGISYEAKKIYHALDALGPQPTMTLRRNAGLDGKNDNKRYHRALDELQRKLIVMPIGATRETGNWPSQIFELVARWFPGAHAQARALDLRRARASLITRYLKTVIAAPCTSVARLFAVPRAEWNELLGELVVRHVARVENDWLTRYS